MCTCMSGFSCMYFGMFYVCMYGWMYDVIGNN